MAKKEAETFMQEEADYLANVLVQVNIYFVQLWILLCTMIYIVM